MRRLPLLLLVLALLAVGAAVISSAPPVLDETDSLPLPAELALVPPHVLPTPAAPPPETSGKRVLRKVVNSSDRRQLNAVETGLVWLAGKQNADGSWSAEATPGSRTAVTGLALLAFMGAGETHKHGKHRKTIKNGLKNLKIVQEPSGCFGPEADADLAANHAIATLAMSEAYELTGSPLFRQSAQQGLKELFKDRIPGTAVGFWQVLALKSAIDGKLRFPAGALEDAKNWLDWVTDARTGIASCGSAGLIPDTVAGQTAAAALCRILLGEDPKKSGLVKGGTAYVAANRPKRGDPDLDADFLFFGSAACFQQGGDTWKKWYPSLKDRIYETVVKEGKDKSTWKSSGDSERLIGTVGTTALMLMSQQIYYRYYTVLGARR